MGFANLQRVLCVTLTLVCVARAQSRSYDRAVVNSLGGKRQYGGDGNSYSLSNYGVAYRHSHNACTRQLLCLIATHSHGNSYENIRKGGQGSG
jgi:hypothetical protein